MKKKRGGPLGKILGPLLNAASEEREKLEYELAFVVMIFTLLASSGVSPYDCWKKMRRFFFLPNFKKEAEEVVRQVEVLGKDPMTVMQHRAEQTDSKLYRNFLGGFVSSVRSGGKMADYLRSELKVIFELRHGELTRSVEKAATLVEAYSVMLIVVLCAYILFVVFSSAGMSDLLGTSSMTTSPVMSYLIAFILLPVLSLIFILLAHNMQKSSFGNLKDLYKKALMVLVPCFAVIAISLLVPSIAEALGPVGLPEIATICFVVGSLIPALQYHKIAKINYNAEDSIPPFIRDVTEAHKIGLSPEKSIVQATKRKSYGDFQKMLELMRSQIEWGVPIRKTFTNISKGIRSWSAIANLAMMVETIEIGGDSTKSLEILSEYSEKERELQINRRALLKPYVLLTFVWSILIAVTTIIVSMTTQMMSSVSGSSMSSTALLVMNSQLEVFSVGIILQCWLSGFFVGKISEGNLGAGFKYAALLAATAYVSLIASQVMLSGLFGSAGAFNFGQ